MLAVNDGPLPPESWILSNDFQIWTQPNIRWIVKLTAHLFEAFITIFYFSHRPNRAAKLCHLNQTWNSTGSCRTWRTCHGMLHRHHRHLGKIHMYSKERKVRALEIPIFHSITLSSFDTTEQKDSFINLLRASNDFFPGQSNKWTYFSVAWSIVIIIAFVCW